MHIQNSLVFPGVRGRIDLTYSEGFQQELKLANTLILTHNFQTMKEQILSFQASHIVELKPGTTLNISNCD